jgi:peptide-methionine (R)-S-oxide reductase
MEDKEALRKRLTEIQWKVTQESYTERPFTHPYTDLTEKGKYFCIVCSALLFTSTNKFHSGCGWPAFFDSVEKDNIKEVQDLSHGLERVEVRCFRCDAHLGHVFNDGPRPTGIRYCINGAAMNFIKDT